MNIQPTIQQFPSKTFMGISIKMSLTDNLTSELWRSAISLKPAVDQLENNNAYSIECYPEDYFNTFTPEKKFEKWAAFLPKKDSPIMNPFVRITIPKGRYAVFHFKGSSANAFALFSYIFNTWLPTSGYKLDHRPHFAVMGEKYKNNDASSEEEIWIPIK